METHLREAIAKELEGIKPSILAEASEELSKRYRNPERTGSEAYVTSEALHYAYLASRMPATYAAVQAVLVEILARIPHLSIETLLDLGAGPGTALWAIADLFPALLEANLIEKDSHFISLGKRLAAHSNRAVLRSAKWHQGDLRQELSAKKYDLVILSYAIGELPSAECEALIKRLWQSVSKVMIIIEPGTMAGFARIREARQLLLAHGAYAVAPCPHCDACPMPQNDWCHFATRLERSSSHRRAKGATLSYEDEKFSYFVCAKEPVVLPSARILRHPQKHAGHLTFELCTAEGLKKKTISRKQGEEYKQARKLDWGSSL